MSTLAFYAQFIASKVGLNGVTVTWDVERITRSDGTRSALVTGGATTVAIGRRGLYGYLLSGADTTLYDYAATAITADTTVDQKEIAALWTMYETDGVKPTVAGRTLDVSATGEAGVDWANVGTPDSAVALTNTQINSVSSTISANVVQMNGDTDPVDNLVLALGTGGLVEKLNSMLEAAGLAYRFTAAALAEAPTEAGTGTGTYADTIADGVTPLDGVRVQLSTDAIGSNRVYEAYTNALGVFTMNPDPGTYYRWLDLAGYDFAQGVEVVVT